MLNIIIRIIIGLAIILLLLCMGYTTMYFFDPDCGISEPSKVVKIIGIVESILIAIVMVLSIAYSIGSFFLN